MAGTRAVIIAARYSFHGGAEVITERYPTLLAEIEGAIAEVDAERCKHKVSQEKTKQGKILYSPIALNRAFKVPFQRENWVNKRVECDYSQDFYTSSYTPPASPLKGFRDMDFVKDGLGVEVQFGKYSFMVYNVAAKMTIFRNLGIIHAGVEIVPVKRFAGQMSSGVSYFEQFVWDLEQRGIADIDVLVLILGIDGVLPSSRQYV